MHAREKGPSRQAVSKAPHRLLAYLRWQGGRQSLPIWKDFGTKKEHSARTHARHTITDTRARYANTVSQTGPADTPGARASWPELLLPLFPLCSSALSRKEIKE